MFMKEIKNDLKKKVLRTFIIIMGITIISLLTLFAMEYFNLIEKEYFKASDFNIKTIYSKVDFDNDKIDDYTDFVLGARKDAENHPTYVSKYYSDSYPPDEEGVCTDVIWRAFKSAGYSLRDMVDKDIETHKEDYPNVKERDKNIDFRRVNNLDIFFSKYAISLTIDYKEISEFQPGDIVVLNKGKHIGIISDRRNKEGIPYVIHNAGQPIREEDYLTKGKITAHYRFDASQIEESVLIKWIDE